MILAIPPAVPAIALEVSARQLGQPDVPPNNSAGHRPCTRNAVEWHHDVKRCDRRLFAVVHPLRHERKSHELPNDLNFSDIVGEQLRRISKIQIRQLLFRICHDDIGPCDLVETASSRRNPFRQSYKITYLSALCRMGASYGSPHCFITNSNSATTAHTGNAARVSFTSRRIASATPSNNLGVEQ